MGNVTSWLAQCIYPEEQVLWQAARSGDALGLRTALVKLTLETRKHIEWKEPCSGRTALAEAAHRGNRACVVALVEHGANCNAKDYRGNTPLHLACKKGRDDVVQFLLHVSSVFPFETNVDALTPLDLVRRKIADDDSYPLSFERCLEELEKKFCIFSGWLYDEQDNVLSMVSGLSSLSSWKRRFVIVLERGAPDVLELALFSMKPGGARPVCPKSVVLYYVADGLMDAADTKWFNRKDLVFTLCGARREARSYDAAIEMAPLAFAAVDPQGYDAWKRFFTQQQHLLHARTSEPYRPVPVVQQQQQRPAAVGDTSSYGLSAARPLSTPRDSSEAKPMTYVPALAAAVQTQEDEDLRRAIWLSMQVTAAPAPDAFATPSSPPLPVSAPDWDDDDVDDVDDGQSLHAAPSAVEPTAAASAETETETSVDRKLTNLPVVDFARAPLCSNIGECVICFDGPQAAVCVPCGHNAICMACAEEILETTCECPVCRSPIRELIKLYRV